MNATTPERLRIVSSHAYQAVVYPYGFPMRCEFDYEEGEPPRWNDVYGGDPGSPPNAVLIKCEVNGIDITDMLSLEQRERIEEKLIQTMEP